MRISVTAEDVANSSSKNDNHCPTVGVVKENNNNNNPNPK